MHHAVLLEEAVEALVNDTAGLYIDGTFGRGGHSRAILDRLAPAGRLLGIDRDPQAIAAGERLAREDRRFAMAGGSFADFDEHLAGRGWAGPISGLLLDLGVSSPQLDDADRGFSFMRDGALDMRMDPSRGQSAAEWLATAKEKDIARVLRDYGEERFAARMARAIVAARQQAPITRTVQLAKIVAEANPAWEKHKHPATRAFQAIRIFINDELDELRRALDKVVDRFAVGGRLVVISFHSLEDRLVKRFIRREERGDPLPAYLPIREAQRNRRLRHIGRAVKPGTDEIEKNARARSAVMRVAERVEGD